MNHEELVETFWHQGYLVLEDFFKPRLMDRLDDIIRRHFGTNPQFEHEAEFLEKAQTEVIPWFPQQQGEKAFDEIDRDKDLQQLTELILGENWVQLYCMVMWSKKGTSGQAWHQDCEPEDPRVFNLNRLVYTRDIDSEMGGETLVIPGSHRRGLLPAGDPRAEFEDQVVLTPRKGTLVLLHGHTWHRVYPIKGEFRFSTNYRAAPPGLTGEITDVCVYRNMRYRFSTSQVIEERVSAGSPS